jgi:phage gpG-like protein
MKSFGRNVRRIIGNHKSELRDNERGYEALKREFAKMAEFKPEVKVGILGDAEKNARTDGLTNVEIGTVHEFGSPSEGIPERSFLRSTMEAKGDEYRATLGRELRQAFGQKGLELQESALLVLERLGMRASADVKERIREGIAPANAPETVERKGSSTPLVDTGQLINSISWQVGQKKRGADE